MKFCKSLDLLYSKIDTIVVAKRPFGSWGRMMQMCKVAYPEMFEVKEAPKPAKAAPKKAEKKAK